MTEREQARDVARRLAMIRYCQEVSGNVARTCCYDTGRPRAGGRIAWARATVRAAFRLGRAFRVGASATALHGRSTQGRAFPKYINSHNASSECVSTSRPSS
jgi:hypothetical protein